MVAGAAAIKHDLFDTFGFCRFGRHFAQARRAGHVGRQRLPVGNRLAQTGNRRQRAARVVINELHVNVLSRELDAHPGSLRRADHFLTNPPVPSPTQVLFLFSSHFHPSRTWSLCFIIYSNAYCTVLPSSITTCSL